MADKVPPVKPQPTIKGYSAWVFERLVEAKGLSPAEIAWWMIDRWVDENQKFLEGKFGITRKAFLDSQHRAEVVSHPSSTVKRGEK